MDARRIFWAGLLPLLIILLWEGAGVIGAQEEPPEVVQYREDYERYQKITAIKNPLKRSDELLSFLRERRDSKLLKNAQVEYLRILEDLYKEKKFAAITPMAERFIKLFPRVGETYYLYGFALKEDGRIDEAMNSLAKCYVLRVPASVKARNLLNYLYKRQNQGSLAGVDKIIAKARTELGT